METRGKTLERKGQIDYHKKITNKEDRDRDVDMQLTKERLQFLMLRHFSNFMRQVFLSISSCRPDSMDIQIFKQNNHSLDWTLHFLSRDQSWKSELPDSKRNERKVQQGTQAFICIRKKNIASISRIPKEIINFKPAKHETGRDQVTLEAKWQTLDFDSSIM